MKHPRKVKNGNTWERWKKKTPEKDEKWKHPRKVKNETLRKVKNENTQERWKMKHPRKVKNGNTKFFQSGYNGNKEFFQSEFFFFFSISESYLLKYKKNIRVESPISRNMNYFCKTFYRRCLTVFWICLELWIYQGSKYAQVLNVPFPKDKKVPFPENLGGFFEKI